MPSYPVYQVRQFDTLEGIAQSRLGDASRWFEIAQLNKLRFPFISDDPEDKYGLPLLTTTLASAYDGGFRLYLDGFAPGALAQRNVVLLRGRGGIVDLIFADTGSIFGWGNIDPATHVMAWSPGMLADFTQEGLTSFGAGNVLYLENPLAHYYAAGTPVVIFADPQESVTRVVSTGDVIYLPVFGATGSGLSFDSLLGTDLALDSENRLTLDAATRDIAVISGSPNLAQAMRLRLHTEQGTLPYHPGYGNPLIQYLGYSVGSLTALAYSSLTQAILDDERVSRIQQLIVSINGDTVSVQAALQIADDGALVTIGDIIKRAI